MRPRERIEPMLGNLTAALREMWTRHPDMRLAQVLANTSHELFGTTDLGCACLMPDDELDRRLTAPGPITRCETCARDLPTAAYHFVNRECPDCHCRRVGTRRG